MDLPVLLLLCFSEGKWLLQHHYGSMTSLGRGLLGMSKPLVWVSLALYMRSYIEITTWYCKFPFTHMVSQIVVIFCREPSTCLEHRRRCWLNKCLPVPRSRTSLQPRGLLSCWSVSSISEKLEKTAGILNV